MEQSEQNLNSPQKKSVNPMLIVGVVLALLFLVGGLVLAQGNLKSNDNKPTPQNPSVQGIESESGKETSNETGEVIEDRSAEITVDIEAGSFFYAPNEIRVKKGQTVTIVLSASDMMHDFNIDELGVTMPVTKAGETNTVKFTADTVGEFEYYCSVGQHRQNGQVGTLIVEE